MLLLPLPLPARPWVTARTLRSPSHLLLFLLTLLLPQDVLTLSSSTESEGESGTSRKPTAGQTSATAVDSDDIQTISSGSEGDDFEDKKNMTGSLEKFWEWWEEIVRNLG